MASWLYNLWHKLQASFWFVPALMAVVFSGLSVGTIVVDRSVGRRLAETGLFWVGEPQGAREMLTTIAGSMITVAGVTFSITIVALTLAASQFGPRLLRSFMRDPGNQIVLGTFISTFLFCLLILRVVSGDGDSTFVPHLSITVALGLALASIGVLIYFIHHVSVSLQAENLAAAIGAEFNEIVTYVFPQRLDDSVDDEQVEVALPEDFDEQSRSINAYRNGYVQTIQRESLVALAEEHDLVMEILSLPGQFVVRGHPLLRAWHRDRCDEELADKIAESFVIGSHRTPTQDARYPMHELVSVAVRALSPGINDPFTANTCIDWLAAGLTEVSRRRIPSRYRCGEDERLRLIEPPTTFEQLCDVAFNQIRHFGADYVSVVHRLLETMATVGRHAARREDRAALRRHACWVLEAARKAGHEPHEFEAIEMLHASVMETLKE